MTLIRVFGEGTVSGTGGGNLTSDTADSSTTVSTGETLQFDVNSMTFLEVDETLPITDSGSANFVTIETTIDGNTIGPSNVVEFNYGFLTEDAAGNLYTVWVFAYANSDEDHFYIVSDEGTPTRDGSGDITTVTQTDINYDGQELTVLDATSLTTAALTDTALNDFMLGDGTLTFSPENDDLGSAFGITAATDPVPCFTRGTLILTTDGERLVENLLPGDLVLTKTHGPQPIRWIGAKQLGRHALNRAPKLRPVRIKANALGQGMPRNDLLVSPQHRILVRSKIAQRLMGSKETLVAAKHLVGLDDIAIAKDIDQVEYFHFLFDAHEVIWANGAETESLFTGVEALKTIGAQAREEIFALFPELAEMNDALCAKPAAPIAKGQIARQLTYRHQKNLKPLFS